jgi:cytochrome c oxidase assembly protein subunit 15
MLRWGTVLVAVAFAQIILGALVAGIDAGRSYSDWPLMGGEVFPTGAMELTPVWTNFLENPGLVQFNHRLLGYVLVALGVIAWLRARSSALGDIRKAFLGVAHVLALQLALGVVTILSGVPWQLAILHQLMAVVVFVAVIRGRFAALYPRSERIARS